MKKIIVLALCLTLSFQLHAQEVGIIMGTARDLVKEDVEDGLIRLKNMGVKYLEGAGNRNMPNEEYKKLLDKHGFQVIAGGTSFEQLEDPEKIKDVIKNLNFFGAKYAVCYWIPHNGDNFTFEDMKKGVAVFNKAGKQFAEAGISFLYHAHGYEFRPYDGEGSMYDYMMANTDPRYVNVEMDVFWMRNPGQDPAALMRKYPNRIPVTHLKDRMIGSVDNLNGRQDKQRNVVLGTGDVNIAEVLKAAKEIGVKYHFIEDESARADVQLPMHLAYLRTQDLAVKAIDQSVIKLHKAMMNADSANLAYLTCEELTYGHSSGKIEGRKSFINSLTSGESDFVTIDFGTPDITVKGDVAWARSIMKADVKDGGVANSISLKILYVWIKEQGYWKLLARQAVK